MGRRLGPRFKGINKGRRTKTVEPVKPVLAEAAHRSEDEPNLYMGCEHAKEWGQLRRCDNPDCSLLYSPSAYCRCGRKTAAW